MDPTESPSSVGRHRVAGLPLPPGPGQVDATQTPRQGDDYVPELSAADPFTDPKVAFEHLSDPQLAHYYAMYAVMARPWLARVGRSVMEWGFKWVPRLTRRMVRDTMFEVFCGGETLRELGPRVAELNERGVKVIVDYAVEGEKTELGFDLAADHLVATTEYAGRREGVPFCALKLTALARFELLEKISAKETLTADERVEWSRALARLERVIQEAHRQGISMLIDAEESWIQPAIDELALDLMQRYNGERAVVYTTLQMYLRGKQEKLAAWTARARAEGFQLGVKLVRGAYLDKEAQRAHDLNRQSPLQPSKAATDRAYLIAQRSCLENLDTVSLMSATHNAQSVAQLMAEIHRLGVAADDPRVYSPQLMGMATRVTNPLARGGRYNVANFLPYGPVDRVAPYMGRRLDENPEMGKQAHGDWALVSQEMTRRMRERWLLAA